MAFRSHHHSISFTPLKEKAQLLFLVSLVSAESLPFHAPLPATPFGEERRLTGMPPSLLHMSIYLGDEAGTGRVHLAFGRPFFPRLCLSERREKRRRDLMGCVFTLFPVSPFDILQWCAVCFWLSPTTSHVCLLRRDSHPHGTCPIVFKDMSLLSHTCLLEDGQDPRDTLHAI